MAKWWAFALMFLCTLFTSFAQLFYKKGALALSPSVEGILFNTFLLIGICLYVVGAFLMLAALRGGELSVLYPIIATSFIWVSLISAFFLGESMNILKWFGVASIIFGISLIGFGSGGAANAS
ncbi:MAG: EamA family transporter [Candidatus Woesearchaeota archaeon]